MASKVQFVKQEIDVFAVLPKLAVFLLLCLFFYQYEKKFFFLPAAAVLFLLILFNTQLFFPICLQTSINNIKQGKFEAAIPYIHQTIDFFTKHAWIDKYRALLLISNARSSLLESNWCNLAFCHLQLGAIQDAIDVYEDILKKYPNNINAQSGLRTIRLVSEHHNKKG